ncbi:tetratricopeptide repeat protein [Amycolatopsis jejuensis]|uniref:tetratricopeptide repeat protein n=1 Tax=Amycolatopsis jejuensis TaxID=330084 RepID=UPI0005279E77|nr:tetratricopeptide repeat protein [Amycolatopsis jejuensis]
MTEPAAAEAIDRLCDDWRMSEAEDLGRKAVQDCPDDPERWIALGKAQLHLYHREEALESFERAVRCPDAPPEAVAWQVAALSRLRRFAAAEEVAADRPEAEILHARARVYCDQQDWAGALPFFEQALAADPGHVRAGRWRVMTLASLRRFDEAVAAAQELIDRYPGSPDPLVTMGWIEDERDCCAESLGWFERALEVDPRSEWALRLKVGALRRLEQFDEAEAAGRAAIALRPREPRLLVALGWVEDDRDREEESLAWYEQALAIEPQYGRALEWRLSALRQLERYDEAETALQAALELRPDDADLLLQGGWLAECREQFEEAADWFGRVQALEPWNEFAARARVRVLHELKRFDEAARAVQEAVERFPDDAAFLVQAAKVAEDRSRFEEALSWYERALGVDPEDTDAQLGRLFVLRVLRRFETAEKAAREVAERSPDNASCWVVMGWIEADQDRYEAALTWYDRALDLDPEHRIALRSKALALRLLRRYADAEAVAQSDPEDPDLLVQLGWIHDARYEYEQALETFRKAADVDPEHAWAWRSRVAMLASLRRFAEAEEVFEEGLRHCPDDVDLLVHWSWLEGDRNRLESALRWCARALDVDPGYASALGERVAILRRLRRFDEAEAAAAEAIGRRPDDPGLLVQQGWLRFDRQRLDDALDSFARALALDPAYEWALRSQSVTFFRLRRFDEAKAANQAILDRQPDNVLAFMNMASLHSVWVGPEAGLQWYERVLEVEPRHAGALEWRVTMLRRLRRFDEARAALKEALALHPDAPDLLVERAWLEGDEDRFEDALATLRQVLEADPLHESALVGQVTALGELDRYDEAEAAAKEAIRRRPDEPDLLVELGLLHDEQLQYEESLTWFEKALRIDPADVSAINGRSAALRSLRRFDEAERGVVAALGRMPWNRALRRELVWIHHDSRRLDEADQELVRLEDGNRNPGEEAETAAQAGWVRFAAGDYPAAEERFRTACEKEPDSVDHRFGLAWCLVRQATPRGRDEAEQLCFSVLEQQPRHHAAHTCLGVLGYQRRQFAQAEQHFRRAVELDRHHASYVDLGALYSQLGRFEEAEEHLTAALARDWYDAQAHVELGYLHLQRAIDDPASEPGAGAVRHFRQARQIDPANGSASLGLAVALTRSAGDFVEGEDVLQQALRRNDCDLPRWQLLVAVAKLLIERGDATQGRQFHADALAHAQEAISLASNEAEPYFVAAVARYKLAESAGDFPAKPAQRRKAIRDLRRCVKIDPGNVEAQRSLQIMEESLRITRSSTAGSVVVVVVGIAALAALWTAFFLSDKVSGVMLTTLTPVLVGLVVLGLVLPFLIRLKLPGGVEADLSASIRQISSGPTGEETFGPGRFSVTAAAVSPGPQGQLARL